MIGDIIGIRKLDNAELETKRARDKLKEAVENESGKVRDSLSALSQVLGHEVASKEEILIHLNPRLRDLTMPEIDDLDELTGYEENLLKLTREKTPLIERVETLRRARQVLMRSLIDESKLAEINRLVQEISAFAKNDERTQMQVFELLEKGERVLLNMEGIYCPLCEQPVQWNELRDRVQRRMAVLRELSGESSKIKDRSSRITNALELLSQNVRQCLQDLKNEPEILEVLEQLQKCFSSLEQLIEMIRSTPAKLSQEPLELSDVYSDTINENLNAVISRLDAIIKESSKSEDERTVKAFRLVTDVNRELRNYEESKKKLKAADKRFAIGEKLYELFKDTSKESIQKIYQNIESEVARLYGLLHPDEEIRGIQLSTAPNKRASALLKMELFGRKGEDPRGLASEGHLDSMGLCIFLAFIKRFNENCPLVVLDDVVSSIDSGHRSKISRILVEEYKDNQLIITTHDEVWFKQLYSAQRTFKQEGNYLNYEIVEWDRKAGPRFKSYKSDWEKIEKSLTEGNKEIAGSAARRYLEGVLVDICQNFHAAVEFNGLNATYDVGDLLPPAKKKVISVSNDDAFTRRVKKAFEELELTIVLGNLLSHNNPVSSTTINEVREFCVAVENLRKACSCDACGEYLEYVRDRKEICCENPKCSSRMRIVARS